MDRFTGPDAMNAEEAYALALLMIERQEWERDMQAVAAYERWYLDRLTMEDSAENFDVR